MRTIVKPDRTSILDNPNPRDLAATLETHVREPQEVMPCRRRDRVLHLAVWADSVEELDQFDREIVSGASSRVVCTGSLSGRCPIGQI